MLATCCGVPLSGPSHCQQGDRPASPELLGDVLHQSGPDEWSTVRWGPAPSWGDKVRSHAVEKATGRTGWREQRPGGARGPALSARPGTRGCRHLSRSAAGGPGALVPGRAAPGPLWPTHHAHEARHHLRLRHEAPQVEGAASIGRAIGPALHVAVAAEPRMAGNQPDCPASSRPAHGGGAGRRQGGANRREVGAVYPSVPVVEVGRNLELRLRRQGAEAGGKAHPWESVLLS